MHTMLNMNSDVLERLSNINWFVNLGEEMSEPSVLMCNSAKQALKSISGAKWENAVLYFQGEVTEQLSLRQTSGRGREYLQWNQIVDNVKKTILPELKDRWICALEKHGLGVDEVIRDISFNVLLILVIHAYAEIVEVPEFFSEMLQIYEKGHLPCGWRGKKDKGCMIAY